MMMSQHGLHYHTTPNAQETQALFCFYFVLLIKFLPTKIMLENLHVGASPCMSFKGSEVISSHFKKGTYA